MEESETREATESAPVATGTVALKDGRAIAWTAWGAPEGATVIGQPHLGVTGRSALAMDVEPVTQAGIRVVFVCRAGLGPSTRRPGRSASTDAEDMLAVIDALGIDRAHLLGECGGTGAVLALAARWPDRVHAVALVSPMAPLAGGDSDGCIGGQLRLIRRCLRFAPIANVVARLQIRAFARSPSGFLDRAWQGLPASDRRYVEDPIRRALTLAASSEFYTSPDRYLDEWRSIIGPWGVDLSAVRSHVLIDHGALDATSPVAMATWLSGRLPSVDLRIDPDRGHFVAPNRLVADLQALLALREAS